MKKGMNVWVPALLTGVALAVTGCSSGVDQVGLVKEAVVDSLDVALDAEVGVKLGPVAMLGARTVLAFVPDDDEEIRTAREVLRHIRRVEVGVFNIRGPDPVQGGAALLADLDRLMSEQGMEPMVRHLEPGELVSIYAEASKRRISRFCVVVLDDRELVVVRLRGRLDKVVARALAQGDFDPEELKIM